MAVSCLVYEQSVIVTLLSVCALLVLVNILSSFIAWLLGKRDSIYQQLRSSE